MDIMLQRILELVGSKHGAGKELCDALGVKSNTVTEWKKGRMKSYTKYAPQIADYYGVSLDWLSGLSDDQGIKKSASSEDEANGDTLARIERELSDMSKDELLKVLDMIKVIKR